MHTAQKPKSNLKFVTLDKKSNMSTLWRRVQFLRICSDKEKNLAEKAQETKVTIPQLQSPEDGHIYCILLFCIVFGHISKNLSHYYLFDATMNIYF